MATTSKEINLGQLTDELSGKGLIANFTDPKNKLILPADNVDLTEDELKAAIANHIAVNEEKAKATAEGKLAALGLTTDDLRALGL
jgi:hypothetical protein